MELKKKNYGIDVLKIISVLFIITTHVIGQGGILRNVGVGSTKYYILHIIQAFAYIAVNCYALISGYLNVDKKFKVKKLLNLWLQVFFYAFGFTILFSIIRPETVGLKEIVKGLFPICCNQYWYFTAYFVVYMISPYLNCILTKMNRKDLLKLIIILITIFSVIPTIRCYDLFGTRYGFSPLWLAVLYMIGGYFKLHVKEISKKTKIKLTVIWFVTSIITASSKFIADLLLKGKFELFSEYALFHYTSITVLAAGLCLFTIFAYTDFKGIQKKIANFIAPLTFGIYIIHVNAFIWQYILLSRFSFVANYSIAKMILSIILIILGIFVICTIIEYLRTLLFKLLRINKFAEIIDNKVTNLVEKTIKE